MDIVNDYFEGQAVSVAYCDRTNCAKLFVGQGRATPLDLAVGGWFNEDGATDMLVRVGPNRYRLKSGQALDGWIMEDDKDVRVTAKSDIPIGHKVALRDYQPGDTVIKYGVDIGKVVKPIAKGEHLHVHNVKTKRW